MKGGDYKWLYLFAFSVLSIALGSRADSNGETSKSTDADESTNCQGYNFEDQDDQGFWGSMSTCLKNKLQKTPKSSQDMSRSEFKCKARCKNQCVHCICSLTKAYQSDVSDNSCTDSNESTDTNKQEDNTEYDCPTQSQQRSGASVGVAVGLMFLGVVTGAAVAAVVCVCVPGLHRRTNIILGRMSRKVPKRASISKEDAYQIPQDLGQDVSTLQIGISIGHSKDLTAQPAVLALINLDTML